MRLVEVPYWLGSAAVLSEVPGRFEEEGLEAEFAAVAAASVVGVGPGVGEQREEEEPVPEYMGKDDGLLLLSLLLLLAAGTKSDVRCSARPSQRRW